MTITQETPRDEKLRMYKEQYAWSGSRAPEHRTIDEQNWLDNYAPRRIAELQQTDKE